MDDGRPDAKDCGRGDGGLTEAIAPAHGDNAEDAEGQVGNAYLELEGIAGRPADGFGDLVRNCPCIFSSSDIVWMLRSKVAASVW